MNTKPANARLKSYTSASFKNSSSKHILSHLGPTCFAYFTKLYQHLLTIDKTEAVVIRSLAILPFRVP